MYGGSNLINKCRLITEYGAHTHAKKTVDRDAAKKTERTGTVMDCAHFVAKTKGGI